VAKRVGGKLMTKITTEEIDRIITEDLEELLEYRIIYKYSSFDVAVNNILIKQTLKFVNPSTFNDPFDCNEHLIKINLDNEFIPQIIRKSNPKITEEFERTILNKMRLPETWAESFTTKKKEYKVSCFSKKCNNVLMWSHYAEKHKGICIGFDFPHKVDEKFILSNVKYLNQITPVCGKAMFEKVMLYWLTTKSSAWQYEDEVRALLQDKGDEKIISFDKKYIKEVIFGCNVSNQKVDDTFKKLDKTNLNMSAINFKRAIIDKNSFRLKLIDI
jgi:hypothetical protein